MNLKEVSKRIENLISTTKTPKKALSEFLGISELELDNIENGSAVSINSDIIEKISNLYFCPVNYILNGTDAIENRVDFNYDGYNAKELENMSKIFKITKNQIEMDKMLEDDINDNNSEAEEIYKQRWAGLSLNSSKPLKQTHTNSEPVETREEKEQREFEKTQWDEYFFNDFNPYGL